MAVEEGGYGFCLFVTVFKFSDYECYMKVYKTFEIDTVIYGTAIARGKKITKTDIGLYIEGICVVDVFVQYPVETL